MFSHQKKWPQVPRDHVSAPLRKAAQKLPPPGPAAHEGWRRYFCHGGGGLTVYVGDTACEETKTGGGDVMANPQHSGTCDFRDPPHPPLPVMRAGIKFWCPYGVWAGAVIPAVCISHHEPSSPPSPGQPRPASTASAWNYLG